MQSLDRCVATADSCLGSVDRCISITDSRIAKLNSGSLGISSDARLYGPKNQWEKTKEFPKPGTFNLPVDQARNMYQYKKEKNVWESSQTTLRSNDTNLESDSPAVVKDEEGNKDHPAESLAQQKERLIIKIAELRVKAKGQILAAGFQRQKLERKAGTEYQRLWKIAFKEDAKSKLDARKLSAKAKRLQGVVKGLESLEREREKAKKEFLEAKRKCERLEQVAKRLRKE
ncbi:fa57be47-7e96-4ac4-8387-ce8a46debb53 [Sclerotinia trifoliorum]|uniref:Fa57be47-7e96-4ac4-8387-ce8a46debb53 n=1 Tax=Sclerotinia trifoliorum TaxID=28548 RepID=A0A8H2VRY7_9HELO|nr:fa57be47-7e96-4ac4-8387-ce8a46debb53 [Sclerotinia trifoliorum]